MMHRVGPVSTTMWVHFPRPLPVVAHGYLRTTEDVDILVTQDGLQEIHRSVVGLGYRPVFEGRSSPAAFLTVRE